MEFKSHRIARNLLAVGAAAIAVVGVVIADMWIRDPTEIWFLPDVRQMPVWDTRILHYQLLDIGFKLLPAFVAGLIATRPVLLGAFVGGAADLVRHALLRGGNHGAWLLLSGHDLTPDQHAAAMDSTIYYLAATAQGFAAAAVYGAAAGALGWYVRAKLLRVPIANRVEPKQA